jgi:hypothetical protein
VTASSGEVVVAARRYVIDAFGPALLAGFIYGSVADATSGPHSDIDCFVLIGRVMPPRARLDAAAGFARLQRRLGFVPDPDFPIEVFTADACDAALDGPALATCLRPVAAGGVVVSETVESDDVEILRALLDTHLVLVENAALDRLVDRAERLVSEAFAVLDPRQRSAAHLALRLPDPRHGAPESPR